MNLLNCTEICAELKRNIGEKIDRGKVHSVFKNSINVLLRDGHLVTVISKNKPVNVYCLKVDSDQSFIKLGFKAGQPVIFFREKIVFEQGQQISLINAEEWNADPDFNFQRDTAESLKNKADQLAETLRESGNRFGIYALLQCLLETYPAVDKLFPEPLPYGKAEKFIAQRFEKFINTFYQENAEELEERAKDIIGFGIGLTPSMDDFITGLMISNLYASYFFEDSLDKAALMNREIVKFEDDRTTVVSREMLRYAAQGKVNQALRDVMLSMFSQNKTDLPADLEQVLALGESSGTDTLLGVYIGIVLKIQKRSVV